MLNIVSTFQVWLPYNHMLYPISFHFHFVEIFNPYPDWVTFFWSFHLVSTCCGGRVYLHLLCEKSPPIILYKMLLLKMTFLKRAL